MISQIRIVFVLSTLAAAMLGCSDGGGPPMISDGDAAPPPVVEDNDAACTQAAPGCPCTQVGAQVSCGTIYRISGTHVDCSEGYYTCQADGGWSECVGPSIFDGG